MHSTTFVFVIVMRFPYAYTSRRLVSWSELYKWILCGFCGFFPLGATKALAVILQLYEYEHWNWETDSEERHTNGTCVHGKNCAEKEWTISLFFFGIAHKNVDVWMLTRCKKMYVHLGFKWVQWLCWSHNLSQSTPTILRSERAGRVLGRLTGNIFHTVKHS